MMINGLIAVKKMNEILEKRYAGRHVSRVPEVSWNRDEEMFEAYYHSYGSVISFHIDDTENIRDEIERIRLEERVYGRECDMATEEGIDPENIDEPNRMIENVPYSNMWGDNGLDFLEEFIDIIDDNRKYMTLDNRELYSIYKDVIINKVAV